MSLRKDVFELLWLYEGENPREAFKPHLQPEDWQQREKDQLVFRSQVPDHLEAAYDIAIGEGLLESHLLAPEQQIEAYKTFGTYDIPQDQPWPVFPAWSDAMLVLTERGRSALAMHRTKSGVLSERLKVDLARGTLTLDGKSDEVPSENALRWVRVLAGRPGVWISSPDLAATDEQLTGVRPDKLKRFLPAKVRNLIESKPGRGSRLRFGA